MARVCFTFELVSVIRNQKASQHGFSMTIKTLTQKCEEISRISSLDKLLLDSMSKERNAPNGNWE